MNGRNPHKNEDLKRELLHRSSTTEERKANMLEERLKENTAALMALTSALAVAGGVLPKATVPAAPKAEPKKDAKTPATGAVNYDALAAKFLDLVAKKGRDAALAVIAPLPALNAIKTGEQAPGQYAALAVKIDAALSEGAATASLV